MHLAPLPATLVIRSTPKGIIIKDGKVIGNTGEPLVLPAGRRDLTVVAENYSNISRSVSLPPNGKVDLELTLSPLPRQLNVTCEPIATVLVDGQTIGKTDEKLSIPVGEHEITLVAEGYKEKSFKATVTPGRDVTFDTELELIPLPGKLHLICTPQATVFADGKLVGATSEAISLSHGEHRVELFAESYTKKALIVRIPLGKDVAWTGTLDRLPGSLLVGATIPTEYGKPKTAPMAKLTIGDVTNTVTLPHRQTGLAPNAYQVTLDAKGYNGATQATVNVLSGEETYWMVSLVPKPSSVRFIADPPDAKLVIYREGKKIGKAGDVITLMPFIQHVLEFRAKGYETITRLVTLPTPGHDHGDLKLNFRNPRSRKAGTSGSARLILATGETGEPTGIMKRPIAYPFFGFFLEHGEGNR